MAGEALQAHLAQLEEETNGILTVHHERLKRYIDTWTVSHQQLLQDWAAQARVDPAGFEARPQTAGGPGDEKRMSSLLYSVGSPELLPLDKPAVAVVVSEAEVTDYDPAEDAEFDTRNRRGSDQWATPSKRDTLRGDPMDVTVSSQDLVAHPRLGRLAIFVQGPTFLLTSGLFISMSAILVGFETNYVAEHGETTIAFYCSTLAINVFFSFELVLRIVAFGFIGVFFRAEDRLWNAFDLLIVMTSLCEVATESFEFSGFMLFRGVRAVRLLRIARVVKLLRLMTYFQEFRKIFILLAKSLKTLGWSLIAVIFVIYIYAVLFTQMTAEHLHSLTDEEWTLNDVQLEGDFGNVGRSTYSLYTSVTGGRNWGEFMDPLQDVHWVYAGCFIAYISMTFFGVLNIVTSVFVECAMQTTQRHRDLLVEEKRSFESGHLKHMRAIFREIDDDNSGSVEYHELKKKMAESISLQDYFKALELNATDTFTLFDLLDQDNSGSVSIDEFCDGCMRLRAEARSFDINCLIQENKKILKLLRRFSRDSNQRIESLHRRVGDVGMTVKHLHAEIPKLAVPQARGEICWDPSSWTQEDGGPADVPVVKSV